MRETLRPPVVRIVEFCTRYPWRVSVRGGTKPRLWLPDDITERSRRANSPEGHVLWGGTLLAQNFFR